MHYIIFLFVLPLFSSVAVAESGTIQFGITRQKRSPDTADFFQSRHRNRLARRRAEAPKTVQQILDNYNYIYYANVLIGTPGQEIQLIIDTGSSDTWVQTAQNVFCQENPDSCSTGIFDLQKSSTYDPITDETFSIQYSDYTYARGTYAHDSFGIGGATVKGLTMGVATEGNATDGFMGLGFPSNEALVYQNGLKAEYPNLPQLLYKQKYIKSLTYSLWLNDLHASTGSVLFGGIDRARFEGDLAILPLADYVEGATLQEFFITLDAVSITEAKDRKHSLGKHLEEPALLDSGTSFMYIPEDVFQALGKTIKAEYNEYLDAYVQTCDITDSDATVDFQFKGVTIKIPFVELVLPATTDDGDAMYFESGEPMCMIAISSNTGIGASILGDTFLRSAYVVYDLDNALVGLAQTVYNATQSDIVAISKGRNGIAKAASRPVSTKTKSKSQTSTTSKGHKQTSYKGSPNITSALTQTSTLAPMTTAASVIGNYTHFTSRMHPTSSSLLTVPTDTSAGTRVALSTLTLSIVVVIVTAVINF
ncbi:aspartic peptidase domain-containing protein [Lipomyces arxii]|uniref:aspartic peptidase domain-containing protein n=1 Tax=Lipomyces arxii TaxID=56418 RepID=UPI0034CF523E